MIKNMRCLCGRRRKPSHERLIKEQKARSPLCMVRELQARKIHNDKIFGRDR